VLVLEKKKCGEKNYRQEGKKRTRRKLEVEKKFKGSFLEREKLPSAPTSKSLQALRLSIE
jgi:hypothetical protein